MELSGVDPAREMSTKPAWDAPRWRGHEDSSYYDQTQQLRLSAPGRYRPSSQNVPIESYPGIGSKSSAKMVEDHRRPSTTTDPSLHASVNHSGLREWPTAHTDALDAPQKLPNFSSNVSPWLDRGYDYAEDGKVRQPATLPLTLQIPKDQELPRIASVFGPPLRAERSESTDDPRSSSAKTLPSFASLQEQARRPDDSDEGDIAPVSTRLPCHGHPQLQPMVLEIATAVAELNESMQQYVRGSASRIPDCPKDSLTRAVQWILDRLRCSKADLLAATRASNAGSTYQEIPNSLSGLPSRNLSPSNPLKRQAEPWEHDESPEQKRRHAEDSPEQTCKAQSGAEREPRSSLQNNSMDQVRRSNISSPLDESALGSAYPPAVSPVLPGRSLRALPSPSSLAYPPSAAASLAPHTARSVGSPTTSHAYEVSIHTSSTDSATSAHIAELQHQVTLKSLSLQTLQSEYASLLQKVQRLNVKTQTMERKGNVADQEVNDLTNKNEDLTQQLQALQEQLDESERRRESDREDSSREKDQWMQMLDQSRRLQAKMELDKKSLAQRIATLLTECERLQKDHDPTGCSKPGRPEAQARHDSGRTTDIPLVLGAVGHSSSDVDALQARIEVLQYALEEAKHHHLQLDERTQEILQRSSEIGNVIDRALQNSEVSEGVKTSGASADQRASRNHPTNRQGAEASPEPISEDRTALTAPQSSSPFPFGPSTRSPSAVGPIWRSQEYAEGHADLHSFRSSMHTAIAQMMESQGRPNDHQGKSHSDSHSPSSSHGDSTSNTSGTATQRSPKTNEPVSATLTTFGSHGPKAPTASKCPSSSRNIQDYGSQEADAGTGKADAPRKMDTWTTMPPPPRPFT